MELNNNFCNSSNEIFFPSTEECNKKTKIIDVSNIFDNEVISVNTNSEYNLSDVGNEFLKKIREYVEELETMAVISQDVYHNIVAENLESIGNSNGVFDQELMKIIFNIFYGYNFYDLTIDGISFEVLPRDYLIRLWAVYNKIDKKIINSLLKFKYLKNDAVDFVISHAYEYSACVNEEEFIELFKLEFNSVKKQESYVYKI